MLLEFRDDLGNVYQCFEDHVASGTAKIEYKNISKVSFKAPSFLTGGRIELVTVTGPVYITWKSKAKNGEAEAVYNLIKSKVG